MSDEARERSKVARAREGDRAAFDELVTRFRPRLRSFIGSRMKSSYEGRLDVEEILQDTFVRAFRSMKSFRGEGEEDFRRWLTGIANKAVLRAEETARRNQSLEISSSVGAKEVSPSKALRREERFDRLQGAFNSLSGDYREVVYLTRIEGLSMKEAAEKMGRSPEAVKKLFWRALQQLRKTMTETASVHLPDRALQLEEDHDPD